jgi:hypothetical protein
MLHHLNQASQMAFECREIPELQLNVLKGRQQSDWGEDLAYSPHLIIC